MKNLMYVLICLLCTICVSSYLLSCHDINHTNTDSSDTSIPPYTTTSIVKTTETDCSDTSPAKSLIMPNKIQLVGAPYEGPQEWIIESVDSKTIQMSTDLGDVTVVELTDDQITQLNQLYCSITDYTNFVQFDYADTVFYCGEYTYRFVSIWTTQVELEQYIKLLRSYINGTEYDWSVEFYEGEDISTRNTTRICSFSDGRFDVLQMPQFGGIKEPDGIYTYELGNGFRCHAYYCYTLYDWQTDRRIQYTLYDYARQDDWVYTYGSEGYLKFNVITGKIVTYDVFEDISTEEQLAFAKLDNTNPIRKCTLIDLNGTRYEDCEMIGNDYIGEEVIVRKIRLANSNLDQCDGTCTR